MSVQTSPNKAECSPYLYKFKKKHAYVIPVKMYSAKMFLYNKNIFEMEPSMNRSVEMGG